VVAPVTIGLDMPSWPHGSTAMAEVFVSGTAIMVYLGGNNHSDLAQSGKPSGGLLFYRSRLEGFTNAETIIFQPTNPPADYTGNANDPNVWPFVHTRIEECDIILTSRSRLAYPQMGSYSSTGYYSYGYRSSQWWLTYINNWIGYQDGSKVGSARKLYIPSWGAQTLCVSSEAFRFDGVIKQLDATGISMLTSANGGTMPTGATIAASVVLRSAMLKIEYQKHIQIPTDGLNGTVNNIANISVFANRLAGGLPYWYLDARTWVVWQGNKDRATGDLLTPEMNSYQRQQWLAYDGSDEGYYTGHAEAAKPVLATQVTEGWSGTDGAAWPVHWVTSQVAGSGGSTVIMGNKGRMTGGTVAYSRYRAFLSGMTASTTMELFTSFTIQDQLSSEILFGIDCDNTFLTESSTYPQNGYVFSIAPSETPANGVLTMYKCKDDVRVNMTDATFKYTITAGVKYFVRLDRATTTVRWKLWAETEAEPSVWKRIFQDPSNPVTAGKGFIGLLQGRSATAPRVVDFDDLTIRS